MKKFYLIVCFLQISLFAVSQITSFSVEYFKDFENNVRIYYLEIGGVQNFNQADNIQDKIVKQPLVQRFTFYEKQNNLSKCMIQTDKSFDMSKIQIIINDILVDYQNKEKQINQIINDMPKFIDSGNPENDNEIYKKKKEEWIVNNPEKYNKLNNLSKNSDIENSESFSREKK